MRQNDEFVFKLVGSIKNVVQVHVAELVDLFFAVFRSEERHFRDQDLSLHYVRVSVQAFG